jgi:hypothetical protein
MSRRRMGASPEGAPAVESSATWPLVPQCRRADRLAGRCRRDRAAGTGLGDQAPGTGSCVMGTSSSSVGQPRLPSRIGAGPRCFCVRNFRKTYAGSAFYAAGAGWTICQARPEPVIGIAPSLVSCMRSFDDVWFGTLSETYDCRTEDSAALAPGQPLARRAARPLSHWG